IPASVVRLGGIYGPGRTRLIEQVRNGLHVPDQPVQYTNRIHRDDAAGLLAHLLLQADKRELLAPCYLGVDDEPAPLHEVAQWLAVRWGVSLPDVWVMGNRGCIMIYRTAPARVSVSESNDPMLSAGLLEMDGRGSGRDAPRGAAQEGGQCPPPGLSRGPGCRPFRPARPWAARPRRWRRGRDRAVRSSVP